MSNWIKISERLPPLDKTVLIYSPDDNAINTSWLEIDILQFKLNVPNDYFDIKDTETAIKKGYRVCWQFECGECDLNEYTHWQPLPKPPED